MKKLFFLFIFIAASISIIAQDNRVESMNVLSYGNSELIDNECIIKLEISSDNYYVILTPIGEYSQLYVSKKLNNGFTVKSKDMINCGFDYILIERKIKYIESDYLKNKIKN